MKLRKINEIIDSDNNLIGYSDNPEKGGELESQAKNSTDYNAKISRQPYRYDMLGRFGFTLFPFFEGADSDENVEKLNVIAELMFETYKKTIEHYYKQPKNLKSDYRRLSQNEDYSPKFLEGMGEKLEENVSKILNTLNNKIDESSVAEDVVMREKTKKWMDDKSKDGEVLGGDIKKAVDLINKMDKKDVIELINILEA